MKIFLAGYMGSGKSLVAQQFIQQTNYNVIDLDDQIALMEGKSIPGIFDQRGELYFRKLETRVLKDILEEPTPLIVALGGGTPCYGNNLELIKEREDTRIVYLKASVEFLTNRLFTEKEMRPVISHLTNREDLEDFIRKHLFERGYYYNQADLIINVENRTPQEISSQIVASLL